MTDATATTATTAAAYCWQWRLEACALVCAAAATATAVIACRLVLAVEKWWRVWQLRCNVRVDALCASEDNLVVTAVLKASCAHAQLQPAGLALGAARTAKAAVALTIYNLND